MSSETERLRSAAKNTIDDKRHRPIASTIVAAECLNSWISSERVHPGGSEYDHGRGQYDVNRCVRSHVPRAATVTALFEERSQGLSLYP